MFSSAAAREARRHLCRSILVALATSDLPVFLRPPDEPPDPELSAHLVRHARGGWQVLDGRADSEAMHFELSAGDWVLYTAPEPVTEPAPDAFRGAAIDLVDFMRRGGVTYFVESFHDDTEWIVGLLGETP